MTNTPKTVTTRHPSVVPLYITAGFVLLWALLLPLRSWWQLLLCAALAVGVFLLARKKFPGTVTVTELQPDDSKLEKEAREFLQQLQADDEAIADETVSAKIRELASRTRQIYTIVVEKPEKKSQIRRFSHQYLPMTLKLLDHYATLERTGLDGDNVTRSREEIVRVLDVIVTAFEKQLDALYQAETLDISADITVLKAILKQNGLTDETDFTV